MTINEIVEMTNFLCFICFSIYGKMQGFIDESDLFIYLLFVLYVEIQNGCQNWWENDFCEKSPIDSADTLRIKHFL